ncbi:MAG: Rid family detoxifying hydrolase [Prochlorothrix sp.]|nr:Rid family detoxifying hydrolase [Prochlorothrix sp.]
MTQRIIQTDDAPAPVGPYNQAIVATGSFLFASGQIALDATTGILVAPEDVEAQTHKVMENLRSVLLAAGVDFAQVVKTTIFLANMNDFAKVNAIYSQYFDGAMAPARATVQVARLPKDALVEIDCIAVVPQV